MLPQLYSWEFSVQILCLTKKYYIKDFIEHLLALLFDNVRSRHTILTRENNVCSI